MESKKKGLKRTLGYVWSFIEQFNEDSASMLSNGMVYSTLIAIIPCFAVIYAILNALGALEPVVDLIENTIRLPEDFHGKRDGHGSGEHSLLRTYFRIAYR